MLEKPEKGLQMHLFDRSAGSADQKVCDRSVIHMCKLLSDAKQPQSVPTYLGHQNQANYRINQKVGELIHRVRPY